MCVVVELLSFVLCQMTSRPCVGVAQALARVAQLSEEAKPQSQVRMLHSGSTLNQMLMTLGE